MNDWGAVPGRKGRGALAGAAIAAAFVFSLWIAFAVGRGEGDQIYRVLCGPNEGGEHNGAAPGEARDSAEEIDQIDNRAIRSSLAPSADAPQAANSSISTRCADANEYQSTPYWMGRPQALFNDASEWQAWAAVGVFVLTIWIVLLLRGTLEATRETERLAGKTLKSTQEGTKATLDIGRLQTQAYLSIDCAVVRLRHPGPEKWGVNIAVRIKNFGQSPAKRPTVLYQATVFREIPQGEGPLDGGFRGYHSFRGESFTSDIAPSAVEPARIYSDFFTAEEARILQQNPNFVQVFGTAKWETEYGDFRELAFSLQTNYFWMGDFFVEGEFDWRIELPMDRLPHQQPPETQ